MPSMTLNTFHVLTHLILIMMGISCFLSEPQRGKSGEQAHQVTMIGTGVPAFIGIYSPDVNVMRRTSTY